MLQSLGIKYYFKKCVPAPQERHILLFKQKKLANFLVNWPKNDKFANFFLLKWQFVALQFLTIKYYFQKCTAAPQERHILLF